MVRKMRLYDYFHRMERLGYPQPSIKFWMDENGELDGFVSYNNGCCGFRRDSSFQTTKPDELTAYLFQCITGGGKPYVKTV